MDCDVFALRVRTNLCIPAQSVPLVSSSKGRSSYDPALSRRVRAETAAILNINNVTAPQRCDDSGHHKGIFGVASSSSDARMAMQAPTRLTFRNRIS